MGSGAASTGYVEMWGGNVRAFPDERAPLGANATTGWRDWIFPVQKTGGLNFANELLGAHARCTPTAQGVRLDVSISPALELWSAGASSAVLGIWRAGKQIAHEQFVASPSTPYTAHFAPSVKGESCRGLVPELVVVITDSKGNSVANFSVADLSPPTTVSTVSTNTNQPKVTQVPKASNTFVLPTLNVIGTHYEVGHAIGQRFKSMIQQRLQMREMTKELLVRLVLDNI
jgi:hypothetical protein